MKRTIALVVFASVLLLVWQALEVGRSAPSTRGGPVAPVPEVRPISESSRGATMSDSASRRSRINAFLARRGRTADVLCFAAVMFDPIDEELFLEAAKLDPSSHVVKCVELLILKDRALRQNDAKLKEGYTAAVRSLVRDHPDDSLFHRLALDDVIRRRSYDELPSYFKRPPTDQEGWSISRKWRELHIDFATHEGKMAMKEALNETRVTKFTSVVPYASPQMIRFQLEEQRLLGPALDKQASAELIAHSIVLAQTGNVEWDDVNSLVEQLETETRLIGTAKEIDAEGIAPYLSMPIDAYEERAKADLAEAKQLRAGFKALLERGSEAEVDEFAREMLESGQLNTLRKWEVQNRWPR